MRKMLAGLLAAVLLLSGCMAQAAIVTMSTPRRDAPALMKRAESLGVAIIDRDDIERGRLETLLTALVRQR